MPAARDADPTACDLEPIRIPGRIQPHGVLFMIDPKTLAVLQASANVRALLGLPVIPGQDISALLPPGAQTVLHGLPQVGAMLRTLGAVTVGRRSFSAMTHRSAGLVILELEEVSKGTDSSDELFPRIRSFIQELEASSRS